MVAQEFRLVEGYVERGYVERVVEFNFWKRPNLRAQPVLSYHLI